jgi:EmrB/QacA subfamily drug resistance transporter
MEQGMQTLQPANLQAAGAARQRHRAGLVLAALAASQLMIVLDISIVNIALPQIQRALNFTTTSLSWVVNAYTLTFGGLLLLGGRAGDILGHRRTFITGILLFTLASFLGGLSASSGWLLASRTLQGVGAAIASPTALALITTNFAEGQQRNRAFGVFAAVSGSGAAIGLLAGGMLTSWLSWRWVLFVNVPVGALLALLSPLFVNESQRQPGHFDGWGALTSTAGMAALVYGFIGASQHGWSNLGTIAAFASALVLLAVFLAIETRIGQPITPLHLFGDRNRAGSYAVMLALAAALFGMFFFLTLFVQDVLGYSPLRAGLAFLPMSAAIIVAAQLAARALPRLGPRTLMITGALLSVAGLAWVSPVSVSSGYVDRILGPMLLFGLGTGLLVVPLTMLAVSGVERHEAGAASSLLSVMQQIGGSLGLAILVTVFSTTSRSEATEQAGRLLATGPPQLQAQFQQTGQLPAPYAQNVLAYGISSALVVAVAFALVALVVSVAAIVPRRRRPSTPPQSAAGALWRAHGLPKGGTPSARPKDPHVPGSRRGTAAVAWTNTPRRTQPHVRHTKPRKRKTKEGSTDHD